MEYKPTIYYVFNQRTKKVSMVRSRRGLYGEPKREHLAVLMTPSGPIRPEAITYVPAEDGVATLHPATVADFQGVHESMGDKARVAVLEVLTGGLCRAAAP